MSINDSKHISEIYTYLNGMNEKRIMAKITIFDDLLSISYKTK